MESFYSVDGNMNMNYGKQYGLSLKKTKSRITV